MKSKRPLTKQKVRKIIEKQLLKQKILPESVFAKALIIPFFDIAVEYFWNGFKIGYDYKIKEKGK